MTTSQMARMVSSLRPPVRANRSGPYHRKIRPSATAPMITTLSNRWMKAAFQRDIFENSLLFDPELLQLVAHRAERDAELRRRLGLVVAALFQRLDDGFALELLDVVGQ